MLSLHFFSELFLRVVRSFITDLMLGGGCRLCPIFETEAPPVISVLLMPVLADTFVLRLGAGAEIPVKVMLTEITKSILI